jgi:hypothetical protein
MAVGDRELDARYKRRSGMQLSKRRSSAIAALAAMLLSAGTAPDDNTFEITAAELSTAHAIEMRVPDGATATIRVTGDAYAASTGGLQAVRIWHNGAYQQLGTATGDPVVSALRSRIAWGFPDATNIGIGPRPRLGRHDHRTTRSRRPQRISRDPRQPDRARDRRQRNTHQRPPHPRNPVPVRSARFTFGLAAVVALLALPACGDDLFGDENEFDYKFEMIVENRSDELIYIVRGRPADERPVDGVWFGVLPGETDVRGLGGRAAQNERPGGCFDNQQVWIVRSLSGTKYLNGQHDDDVDDVDDDLEILQFFPSDTCVESDEITYTWSR